MSGRSFRILQVLIRNKRPCTYTAKMRDVKKLSVASQAWDAWAFSSIGAVFRTSIDVARWV